MNEGKGYTLFMRVHSKVYHPASFSSLATEKAEAF